MQKRPTKLFNIITNNKLFYNVRLISTHEVIIIESAGRRVIMVIQSTCAFEIVLSLEMYEHSRLLQRYSENGSASLGFNS